MTVITDHTVVAVPAGTWNVDPAHSAVEFSVRHAGIATVKGRALVVSGTIEGGETPSIEGTVEATSLTTFDADRDAHLRSPEFFDVDRHPELRFVSSSIDAVGDELAVEGTLTIKGVSEPVTLRGRFAGSTVDPWGKERIGLELHGAIDRTAYGLTWNAPLPGGDLLLPDTVGLAASFSAVKAG